MNKYRIVFLVFICISSSCALLRKPHFELPTKHTVITNEPIDSAHIVMRKLLKHNYTFNTLQLKFKIVYADTNNSSENVSAIVRMRRDSLIWISITGPLGIEGMRIAITNDSVKVIDHIEKKYSAYSVRYLQQFIPAQFNLHYLQDIIAGNAVFVDTTNAYIKRIDSLYMLQSHIDDLYINAWCGVRSYKTYKYIINDSVQHLTVTGLLDDIVPTGNSYIPYTRNYTLKHNDGNVYINMTVKEMKLNEPLSYPFRVKNKDK